ncbi:DUF1876 domain-containing protein [Gandjariella thermophila]|uniref:DUF1876 domain-containing protein n=1 Tax=Gandjariella thermophila TaxID=1931992 RepID=A0A4D4IWI2_9PSEU|nr:DUF1876 domain-containing protein [Gandjariella thermophila]GDY28705.1 hypothetical protein GTS_03380 [Gandjariella thermophila]
MAETKHWKIDVRIDEQGDRTRAEARLETRHKAHLVGVGLARRNPRDPSVPEIGDELAVSRALADLAHLLLDATASDIESITHQPAHLSG